MLALRVLCCFACINLVFESQVLFTTATDADMSVSQETIHQTQISLAQILNEEKKKLLSSTSKGNQCPYFTLPNIFSKIQNNAQLSSSSQSQSNIVQQSSMITTPCLDSDSFGNTLSDYIESRICSNITGYHFIAVTPDPPSRDNPFNILPEIIYNPYFAKKKSMTELKAICQCTSICHGK